MRMKGRLVRLAYVVADGALSPFESLMLARLASGDRCAAWLHDNPPVFIIGAPRSGTTLALQALLNRWRFAYVPNLAARLPHAPVVATWLAGLPLLGNGAPTSDHKVVDRDAGAAFASNLGRTTGVWGPHEAGPFWNRWLPRTPHAFVDPGATPEFVLSAMRREVAALSQLFKAPYLNKNVVNSMRIAPLSEAFPNAAFIRVQRDPLDAARSILRAREQARGDRSLWWSVEPPEIDTIRRLEPCAQVVDQVYFVESRIEADRQSLGAERFHKLGYAELCDDPSAALDGVELFLRGRGLQLEERSSLLPARFERRPTQLLHEADEHCLRERVALRWGGV